LGERLIDLFDSGATTEAILDVTDGIQESR